MFSLYKEYRDLLLIYLQIIFIFLLPKNESKKKKQMKRKIKVKIPRWQKKEEQKNTHTQRIRRWNIKTYGFSHKSTSMTFIFGFFLLFSHLG